MVEVRKDISKYLMCYYNRHRPQQYNGGIASFQAENRLNLLWN